MGTPLICARDLAGGLGLPALALTARTVPAPRWDAGCRAIARLLVSVRPGKNGTGRTLGAHVRRVLGPRRASVAPESVRTGLAANEIDSLHVLLRHRSGRGPRLDLEGREHLEDALRGDRGALLLLHSFHWTSHLLTLPAHGFPVLRVTDESHGRFWTSRAGRRWLHPRQIRLESPDGVTRLVARAGSFAHLRRISRALRENRLVLQRALSPGATPGPLRSETVPFMEGRLALGTTPIAIARDAGAPVIPVYPFREGPDRYLLVVDGPLPGGRDALRVAASRLEPRVLRHPDQWTTWRQVRFDAR